MRSIDGAPTSTDPTSPGFAIANPDSLRLDCCGMRCPQPVLRLAVEAANAPAGMIIEIVGDCPTFEKDVRVFCDRRKKTLLGIRTEGARTSIWLRC